MFFGPASKPLASKKVLTAKAPNKLTTANASRNRRDVKVGAVRAQRLAGGSISSTGDENKAAKTRIIAATRANPTKSSLPLSIQMHPITIKVPVLNVSSQVCVARLCAGSRGEESDILTKKKGLA